jgi:signal transduction histidine kinase
MNLIDNIEGDENKYVQILSHFLHNALKFTIPEESLRILIEVKNRPAV